VYNEGLLSRQMDPVAFTELSENKQSSFVHIEKIGDFEYLSAYATFRNNSNEIVGYLNLPYFLRQKELKEEQASSLLALINIYSLLIAISMIVTFIIANRLTEPLTLLQEKIGQIRLGRKNERIDYRKNDEIGGLVSEYNRMIRELEQSADLLARSERESAWREMAKQVAHEVKNPLTPMKLSVQYLLKAWEDKRPDFDERLRKFRDAMIEQIETLSAIASEFSYFAKMPAALKTETDLLQVLNNCLEFYRNNESQVAITFEHPGLRKAIVLADKDQMLRLFNNLIRNAIQAIPEERDGKIDITVQKIDGVYEVRVKDNGMGIPEEIREKIFAPNFTTKNSGMGLGLAMSKTIVENMDGEISYETGIGEGTTFLMRIPALGK
jgi:nitrogen fixation/metabolism regulation signal transduction histidine kinase